MKTRYLLAAVLLLQMTCAHRANVLFAQDLHLGVRGGLSIPSLQGGNSEQSRGYKSRLGPDFGIFGDLAISPHFALEVEILYVGQGGVKEGMQPLPAGSFPGVPPEMTLYANFKNESILNYLEIPVLVKYSFDLGHLFGVYVDGGPNVGFLLTAKTKASGTSFLFVDPSGTRFGIDGNLVPPMDFSGEQSIKSDVHAMNFGFAGGLGIVKRLGPGELSLDGRGSYGLTNIQKGSENGNNRTGCLVITLGYAVGM